MLAGRLFVEVTGAAVRHQDVLDCQSARLSSQQRYSIRTLQKIPSFKFRLLSVLSKLLTVYIQNLFEEKALCMQIR